MQPASRHVRRWAEPVRQRGRRPGRDATRLPPVLQSPPTAIEVSSKFAGCTFSGQLEVPLASICRLQSRASLQSHTLTHTWSHSLCISAPVVSTTLCSKHTTSFGSLRGHHHQSPLTIHYHRHHQIYHQIHSLCLCLSSQNSAFLVLTAIILRSHQLLLLPSSSLQPQLVSFLFGRLGA